MSATTIEWATHTANWLAGCTKASPACKNCYAVTMTRRLATMPNAPARYREGGVVNGDNWTGEVVYEPHALIQAFDELDRARKPRRAFVNSMSDTFHPKAPPLALRHLAVQVYQRRHGFSAGHVMMLLTKRPERLLQWQREEFPEGLPPWLWVGTTVEDQERFDWRARALCQVRASVRFLSAEPLLGPINMRSYLGHARVPAGEYTPDMPDRGPLDLQEPRAEVPSRFQWVIAGGESGRKARPSHPNWFRSLRDQCAGRGVPFLFKQWGEWDYMGPAYHADPEVEAATDEHVASCEAATIAVDLNGSVWADKDRRYGGEPFQPQGPSAAWMGRVGKKAAGRLLDGVEHNAFPAEVSR